MGLPGGTINETYSQDMAIVRTRLQWILLAAFLILLFASPQFLDDYWLSIINGMAITLVAVFGLNILYGYCGQLNLGQAAFMMVGAYASAIVIERFGLNFWASIPFAILGTALIGMLFGLPALRVKGVYLIITTLSAQFIITWVIIHGGDITHITYGIPVPRPTLGGIVFDTEAEYFYLIIPITLLMGFFAKNIARSRVGRAFIAIRDNDLAAEGMGVNLFYYKTLAFFLCATYAGVAGCLWTNYVGIAHFEHYSFWDSVWMLGMIIVGGGGSAMGPVFGTILIKGLKEFVVYLAPAVAMAIPAIGAQFSAAGGMILLSLIIMLFLIFEPRGINHRWEMFKHTYRLFPFSH